MRDRKERGNGRDKVHVGSSPVVCGFSFNPSSPRLRCSRRNESAAALIFWAYFSQSQPSWWERGGRVACRLLPTFSCFLSPSQNAFP